MSNNKNVLIQDRDFTFHIICTSMLYLLYTIQYTVYTIIQTIHLLYKSFHFAVETF